LSAYAAIQRKLDDLGRARWLRVTLATVASLIILVTGTIIYREAAWLQHFASAVPQLLQEANLTAKDAVSLELTQQGTVTFNGRTVGDAAIASRMTRAFEESGRIERVAEVATVLLSYARPDWMPVPFAEAPSLALIASALALLIVHFACFSGLALPLLYTTLLCALLFGVPASLGRSSLGLSLAAVPLFLFAFSLVIRAALVLLDRPNPCCAVAAGVVREAMRLRIAVAFAAIAIVVIPLLPQWIDPTTPLRYQVQTFLSRSLDTMYLVCAFLTVFLGCATVAFEIRDRTAWLTLTKPVSRFSWMLGKWLGLVTLNVCVILVATIAMYSFLLQVRSRPAQDMFDAMAVRDEVLVARVGSLPLYEPIDTKSLLEAVEEAMKADLNAQADIRNGDRSEIEIKKTLAREIAADYFKQLRSIGPGFEREYVFNGLAAARESEGNLSLRFKFYSGNSDPNEAYPVVFFFGKGDREEWTDRQFVAAQSNVVPVPASAIDDDGTLTVRVANIKFDSLAPPNTPPFVPARSSIAFDLDGFELLHRVGGFEDNLFRAQLVNILKLSFLSMLSVVCGSILSFPVAVLVVFTVFSAGSIGPFLTTSVEEYRIRTDSTTLKTFEAVIKAVAGATEFSVRSFGDARANGPVVEGRLVSWELVLRTFALIGIAWSGVMLLFGFIVFRRKEIAIYSGQGG
jgi:ABC-type transport system involved in multi-copper enzyme maturation permease subunit